MPKDELKHLKPYPVQKSMLQKFIILSCTHNFVFSNISFDELNEIIQACYQFDE